MSTNRCKKVRSIIAMLLAVVMMTGMLPTSAFAAGEEITGADGIGNEIITDDGMVERGDGESAEDTVSIGGPDEKGEGNTEDAVGSGEESSQDGNDGTADDSKSPDEVKDNSSQDLESSLEVSIPDGESFDDEEGLSDPYAGEDTPVSVTPLYGSPQNSSGPRRAPARASGTITTGDEMSYNSKWMAEFAPYSSAVVKYFNGQPAYCIEPHKGAPSAGTSVDASAYWGDQRLRLSPCGRRYRELFWVGCWSELYLGWQVDGCSDGGGSARCGRQWSNHQADIYSEGLRWLHRHEILLRCVEHQGCEDCRV
jgi:hypothetical protein